MVTLQSPSKNGRALLKYLLDEKAHDSTEHRNLCVRTIGLMPSAKTEGYIKQFDREWSRSAKNHVVQMRHIIISPSDKEIPYASSNANKFAEMVERYIQKHYPNRRAVICIQQDGSGFEDEEGKKKKILHAHVALSDCDIHEYKGVESIKTGFKYLARTFDEFITKEYKIKIDNGRELPKRRYLKKMLVTEGERDEEGKFFSYQDCIKDKIRQCIEMSDSIEEFYENLDKVGLSMEQKKKKKNDELFQTYYLENLDDISSSCKTKNGTLKSVPKGRPGMRSYKQEGFKIEDIELKIRQKVQERESSAAVTEEQQYYDTGAEERRKFYQFVRENHLDYGQGDEFDEEKFEEAKRLYKEYLHREDEPVAEQVNEITEDESDMITENVSDEISEEEAQKELTYRRYQRAKEEIQLDYSGQKQRERSL